MTEDAIRVCLTEKTRRLLEGLTAKQRRGIIKIIEYTVLGDWSLNRLFASEHRPCTESTFWRKKKAGRSAGWMHQAAFTRAMELAKSDAMTWRENEALADAQRELKHAAVGAARVLRFQTQGEPVALETLIALLQSKNADERGQAAEMLGAAGHATAAEALREALWKEPDENVRRIIIIALGQIAASDSVSARTAALGILRSAGAETAPKSTEIVVDDGITDDERDQRIIALLERARARKEIKQNERNDDTR